MCTNVYYCHANKYKDVLSHLARIVTGVTVGDGIIKRDIEINNLPPQLPIGLLDIGNYIVMCALRS